MPEGTPLATVDGVKNLLLRASSRIAAGRSRSAEAGFRSDLRIALGFLCNDDLVVFLISRNFAFAAEGKRIKMMWFLECAPWTGLPSTLPWFHDDEAEDWTTAGSGYQRNSRDETVLLRTRDDLRDLEAKASELYKPSNARRLVVRVNPVEDLIIRDEAVAERIGRAGAQLGAVVELQGGVLSHVYYTLKRTGANVAIRNPSSFAVRPETFNKLARDKIPPKKLRTSTKKRRPAGSRRSRG